MNNNLSSSHVEQTIRLLQKQRGCPILSYGMDLKFSCPYTGSKKKPNKVQITYCHTCLYANT